MKEIVYVAYTLSNRVKTLIMIPEQWKFTTHDVRKQIFNLSL